ncbi:MAG TPA: CehA/McbA family metallohydrolase [Steroidobacteraceae bacterium]|jgi:TolB protein|nr:CehA/McbA family metallohydrolase [Steroidobacteraceae bacterium]
MPRSPWPAGISVLKLLACGGACLGSWAPPPAAAQRQPVLRQIDVPHSYYFREMYLPQLTSGPSAVAFAPDGRTLVYSMQGSLWRQNLESTEAEELVAGPGYDFQPDWSPDGEHIAFVRYRDDALELAELDLPSRAVRELTRNKSVNVEPHWSPDGQHLAWVSTAGTGHFHIFVGVRGPQGLTGRAVWPERRSAVERYYYSPFDHELSPTWSADGRELIYVGNPETVYGTGALWRRALSATAEPHAIRVEETTWKARPAWSPDGTRVLYSSYAGRQWHQLWITTAAGGGDPIPLSFGEFDATGARWSPDGARIAFISNRAGSTEIWLQDAVGGAQRRLEIRSRRYLQPTGQLRLRTLDGEGRPLSARIAIIASDGRAYAPDDAWMRADDGFDRRYSAFETHYFHSDGDARMTLPAGAASLTVWRGLEYQIAHRSVQVAAGGLQNVDITLQPLALPPHWSEQWQSADVHVHMNYGGTYRDTPERLVRQAAAEDLDVVFDLVVNKEQRIPDIGYFSPSPDAASTDAVLLAHGQEYHTSYWGHLGLLGLNDHYLIPGYSAYANTAAASVYPTNAAVADLAHAQGALVGYVHPFDDMPDPGAPQALTSELPVDVALGKVDYYEVLGFSEHRTSAAVWYRLLNCGFRPAAAAGTDAMANFASMRGPVGMNRVYVFADSAGPADARADPSARRDRWLAGLRAGRTLATNGPLLGLTLEGQPPGAQFAVPSGAGGLSYKGFLRSIVPVDHLELVMDGKVVRTIRLSGPRVSADFAGRLPVTRDGWLLLRAWNDAASPDIFDLYPYATTNAFFFRAAGGATHCGSDAQYFLNWIDRLEAAAAAHPGYNTSQEREATLNEIRAARAIMLQRR